MHSSTFRRWSQNSKRSVKPTAFGWPTIAVDTHIYRVSNRTKLAMGKTVDDVEAKLLKVIPKIQIRCPPLAHSNNMDVTPVSHVNHAVAASVSLQGLVPTSSRENRRLGS